MRWSAQVLKVKKTVHISRYQHNLTQVMVLIIQPINMGGNTSSVAVNITNNNNNLFVIVSDVHF